MEFLVISADPTFKFEPLEYRSREELNDGLRELAGIAAAKNRWAVSEPPRIEVWGLKQGRGASPLPHPSKRL